MVWCGLAWPGLVDMNNISNGISKWIIIIIIVSRTIDIQSYSAYHMLEANVGWPAWLTIPDPHNTPFTMYCKAKEKDFTSLMMCATM